MISIANIKKMSTSKLVKVYEALTGKSAGEWIRNDRQMLIIQIDLAQGNEIKPQHLAFIRALARNEKVAGQLSDADVKLIRAMRKGGMGAQAIANVMGEKLGRKFQNNYITNVFSGKLYKNIK